MKRLLLLITILVSSVSFGQVPSYVPTNGLVGWWGFCGNANDLSGNGHNGIVNGASLVNDRFGTTNSAYSFSGADAITVGTVSVPDLENQSEITFSAWIKKTVWSQGGSQARIISYEDPGNFGTIGTALQIQNSGFSIPKSIQCDARNGQNTVGAAYRLDTTTVWHHLVMVFEGNAATNNNKLRLYVDGVLYTLSHFSSSNYPQLSHNVPTQLVFGHIAGYGSSLYGFGGQIDDIGIWNRQLTLSEIQLLFNANANTSCCAPNVGVDTQSVCDSYTWIDGNIYTDNNNTATHILTNATGCDSTVTLNLTITNSNTDSETVTECDSYTWNANGQTYTQTGQYTTVLTNQVGCDSTVTLNLTITNSNSSSETVTECDSYTWSTNGQTYTQSGQYTTVLTNQDGCDSTVILNLTITNSSSSSITETVCDTYTAPDGQTYTSTGNYTAVVPNAEGCDSTITIDLIVNYSSTSSIVEFVCDNYIAPDGQSYNQTGIYTAIIPNSVGCDSTITIDLTVGNSSTNSITISECDTFTAPDGQTYTSTGNYTAVISNAAGCDSTITIDLTITNSTSSSITETVCDTYTAPDGQTYTSTGNYTAVIPNAEGCDSTITIDLTVNTLTTLDGGADISLCQGDSVILSGSGAQSYAWNNGVTDGQYFTPTVGTTTYTVTGTDVNGCEDTDDVIVSVSGTPELIITGFSPDCQGESTGSAQADVTGGISPYSFVWSNGSITSVIGGIPAGTYSVTVTDDAGCITSGEVIVTDGTDPCFFVPGGLSPNGDGNNDTWGVTGLDNYPDASVMIYNRWGQLLYDVGPDGPPWDGMYLGEELPTADYYYVIDLGNGEVFNGVVTLKR